VPSAFLIGIVVRCRTTLIVRAIVLHAGTIRATVMAVMTGPAAMMTSARTPAIAERPMGAMMPATKSRTKLMHQRTQDILLLVAQ